MLSGEQLRVVKKEFEKPSYNYTTDDNSLWTLYNHILVGLSKCHPRTWMEQQKVVHLHLMAEYKLTKFDDEEVPVKDPNQLDMMDAIAEVEAPEVAYPTMDPNDAEAVILWLKSNTELYSPSYDMTGADVLENIDKGMSPEVIDQIRAILGQNGGIQQDHERKL